MVKSTYCSSRGLEFRPPYPHRAAPNSLQLQLNRIQHPLLVSTAPALCTYPHTDRHIIKNKREIFFKKKYANLYEYSKFLTIEKENTRFSFLKDKNILVRIFDREGKVSCFPPIYMQVHMHVSPCVESRGQNSVSFLFNLFFFLR